MLPNSLYEDCPSDRYLEGGRGAPANIRYSDQDIWATLTIVTVAVFALMNYWLITQAANLPIQSSRTETCIVRFSLDLLFVERYCTTRRRATFRRRPIVLPIIEESIKLINILIATEPVFCNSKQATKPATTPIGFILVGYHVHMLVMQRQLSEIAFLEMHFDAPLLC
jgi:hypothetical protein